MASTPQVISRFISFFVLAVHVPTASSALCAAATPREVTQVFRGKMACAPIAWARQIAYQALSVGGAVRRGVIHHRDFPILYQLSIQLDPIRSASDCFFKGRKGVFRRVPHGSAVTNYQAR